MPADYGRQSLAEALPRTEFLGYEAVLMAGGCDRDVHLDALAMRHPKPCFPERDTRQKRFASPVIVSVLTGQARLFFLSFLHPNTAGHNHDQNLFIPVLRIDA